MESLFNITSLATEAGGVLGAILMAAGIYILSAAKKKIEAKAFFSVENVINRNLRLQALLYECRGVFDCDRVKLFQFHNGDYFLSGESVQKLSITHFALKRGVSSPVSNGNPYLNIPVSVMLHCLDRIKEAENIMFSSVEDLPDEFAMKDSLRATGCHTVAMTAVRNQYGKMYGVLFLTWLSPIDKPKKLDELKHFAHDLGSEIAYQNRK
jgi:hypothetical protein